MTKYITVKLTEDQVRAIIRDLENEMVDRFGGTYYEERIVTKLRKALAQAKNQNDS
jgi:hypothetical protein